MSSPKVPEARRRLFPAALPALLLSASMGIWLGGCAFRPAPDVPVGDGPPRQAPDLSRIPDAVPRVEPRSRGGNPESYEVFGRRYRVLDSSTGFVERGTASWYGRKFHGRKTSNGETYDMFRMTAAHKHLPLPTYARVTNLDNGRSVVVRINDRGPFHGNRIIDLSYAAAGRLGMLANGTARVEVRAIDPARPTTRVAASAAAVPARPAAPRSTTETAPIRPEAPRAAPAQSASAPAVAARSAAQVPEDPTASTQVFLQAGAFSSEHNARQLQARLSRRLEPAVRIAPARASVGSVYRVRIGPLASRQHADLLAAELRRQGVAETRVVID
jgi:rare lipoprotein A